MYVVFKEMRPQKVHPEDGGYICLFDSLYWFESNAKTRVDVINAEHGAYAYYEEQCFNDPTLDGRLIPTD